MQFTEQQLSAITATRNKVVVIATAGAGKTSVLVERIRNMISRGIDPASIVAITYTIAASKQLNERLDRSDIGYIGTLHSYCLRILEENAERIGFMSRITIMDESIRSELLKIHVDKMGWKGSLKAVESEIERLLTEASEKNAQDAELVAKAWYAQMIETGMLDFDGVLYWTQFAMCIPGFEMDPIHLLVDEVQDASKFDAWFYEGLTTNSVFVVGDDAQSIYKFRGGSPDHLMRWYNSSKWQSITLDLSQRCPINICDMANALISKNKDRIDKKMVSASGVVGCVTVSNWPSIEPEIDHMVHWLDGATDAAVLVRTNFLVEVYSAGLSKRGVKVARVEKPNLPSDWSKAKLLLSAMANPENDWLVAKAFSSICLCGTDVDGFMRKAAIGRISVNQLVGFCPPYCDLLYVLAFIRDHVSQATHVALCKIATGIDHISDLLATINQMEREETKTGDGVVVSTYHSAKGLEYQKILLCAFEDEIFPGNKSGEDESEERRLAFVALTRAKESVHISFVKERIYNAFMQEPKRVTPSRFIKEAGL